MFLLCFLLFLNAPATLGLFCLFFVISKKNYKIYNKIMLKMLIQYTVMGFELTTSWILDFSHYHLTKAQRFLIVIGNFFA